MKPSKNQTITLQEVAEKAGVSTATASRALRGYPNVSQDALTRVLEIANACGYTPDPIAKAMGERKGTSRTFKAVIAFVSGHPEADPLLHTAACRRVFEGAQSEAAKLGYGIEYFWAYHANNRGKRLDRILTSRGIRCLLLHQIHESELELDWDRYSVVNAIAEGRRINQPVFSMVWFDVYEYARNAAERLLSNGERPLIIGLSERVYLRTEGRLLAGIQFAAQGRGVQITHRIFQDGDTSCGRWANTSGNAHFLLSKELLPHLETEERKRLAEEKRLHLVESDSIELTEYSTFMKYPLEQVGAAAVEYLGFLLRHNSFGEPERPRLLLV